MIKLHDCKIRFVYFLIVMSNLIMSFFLFLTALCLCYIYLGIGNMLHNLIMSFSLSSINVDPSWCEIMCFLVELPLYSDGPEFNLCIYIFFIFHMLYKFVISISPGLKERKIISLHFRQRSWKQTLKWQGKRWKIQRI